MSRTLSRVPSPVPTAASFSTSKYFNLKTRAERKGRKLHTKKGRKQKRSTPKLTDHAQLRVHERAIDRRELYSLIAKGHSHHSDHSGTGIVFRRPESGLVVVVGKKKRSKEAVVVTAYYDENFRPAPSRDSGSLKIQPSSWRAEHIGHYCPAALTPAQQRKKTKYYRLFHKSTPKKTQSIPQKTLGGVFSKGDPCECRTPSEGSPTNVLNKV
jgi:hypothetical protein